MEARASVYYGTNSIYVDDFFDIGAKYSGVTVGLGQLVMWQQHGFDLDLMYIATSDIPDELDSGGNIKISIGYKYAF